MPAPRARRRSPVDRRAHRRSRPSTACLESAATPAAATVATDRGRSTPDGRGRQRLVDQEESGCPYTFGYTSFEVSAIERLLDHRLLVAEVLAVFVGQASTEPGPAGSISSRAPLVFGHTRMASNSGSTADEKVTMTIASVTFPRMSSLWQLGAPCTKWWSTSARVRWPIPTSGRRTWRRPNPSTPWRPGSAKAAGGVLPAVVTPEAIFSDYAYFFFRLEQLGRTRATLRRVGHRTIRSVREFVGRRSGLQRRLPASTSWRADSLFSGSNRRPNVAAVAVDSGVPTTVRFFGEQTARELVAEHGAADLFCANNAPADTPPDGLRRRGRVDPGAAWRGHLRVSPPERLVEHTQFDTIYHEHFWSLRFRPEVECSPPCDLEGVRRRRIADPWRLAAPARGTARDPDL